MLRPLANEPLLSRRTAWLWVLLEIALVAAVFAFEGSWPAPDVNEPHYLGRCRHHADPTWCSRDFFLNSKDTHALFFAVFGGMTRLLSLSTAAWCGRAATWLLLAIGWRRLSVAIVPGFGWAVLSAGLLVATNYRCHESGEWIVGGFEAKGFAYALVFSALADAITGRWNRAWLSLGAASALHVLVGGWSTLALGFACLTLGSTTLGPTRPKLSAMLPGLAGGALLACAGLVPALRLNAHVSPDIAAEAASIYVYQRLPHHLWPLSFKPAFSERFWLLACGWVALAAFVRDERRTALVRRYVVAALLIAATGWSIAAFAAEQPAWAAGVLRFYWFRLADAALPLGASLLVCSALATAMTQRRTWARPALFVAIALVIAHFAALGYERSITRGPRADGPGRVIDLADWRAVCAWIDDNTPRDALFLTPRSSQTFKWYAQRAEVVTWKDVPQDAATLVEWWRRMHDIHGTGAPLGEKQFYNALSETSEAHVLSVARRYRADYLLTDVEPALALPLIYQNRSYAVYDLSLADSGP